jgi:2-oxoglutarate ferredoxin oxidoreductase subunit beta
MDITYIVMDNQIYGLTKGQLSPTSQKGRVTCTSRYGSMEEPVNPLLYVLAYGAGFVAQASPTDLAGMAAVIEEAIRYPGFAFVNVQSPCVTYGEEAQQIKGLKAISESLVSLGHNPADRLAAMDLAQHYGEKMHLGVFYRNPEPPPTYGDLVKERQALLSKDALPKERILDLFIKK